MLRGLLLLLCVHDVCVCSNVVHGCHGGHMLVRGPLMGINSVFPLWDPEAKLGLSELHGKCLYPLSPYIFHYYCVFVYLLTYLLTL